MIKIIIVLLIVSMILLFLTTHQINETENFSSDEAIQNVASLYNQGDMTVTNFKSTGTGAFNNLTASGTGTFGNLTASGTGTFNNLTATGATNISNLNATSGTATLSGLTVNGNGTVGNLAVTGSATVNGNLNIGGRTIFRTIANAVPQNGWDIVQYSPSNGNVHDQPSCVNACLNNSTALQASWNHCDSTCYCKATPSLNGNGIDSCWTTTIMI